MFIQMYIKEEAKKICEKVYLAPEIPDNKLDGAISKMAPGLNPDYVIAIADTTVFGGAGEGCMFTGECLYVHSIASDKLKVEFSQIDKVDYQRIVKEKNNGKNKITHKLNLEIKDGTKINLTNELEGINIKHLAKILKDIVELSDSDDDFKNTSQTVPLSMMSSEVKKNYIKLVCNFAYSDDYEIDSKEYAEIISLIVRIEMESKDRIDIRGYMLNHENILSNDELLKSLKENLELSSYDLVMKSLIKDLIFINRAQNKEIIWRENDFIVNLSKKLNIKDEQVDLIEETIINDEEILTKRKNDSEIKKAMKDIASKATAVGVPLTAIYLSGSVIGVSAAGITSGLAALGLKGLLIFSPMVAGIGVAILIGVGTNKVMRKVTGISDLENNKQRELMLQEIIRNLQQSINYLIEDVNEITRRLEVEIQKGFETKMKIDELTRVLGMLTKGAQETSSKLDYLEKEKAITHLPENLDDLRLQELTDTATKRKLRKAVMSCYNFELIESKDGKTKKVYKLKEVLQINDLNNLKSILEGIGYNNLADASSALIKGNAKKFIKKFRG